VEPFPGMGWEGSDYENFQEAKKKGGEKGQGDSCENIPKWENSKKREYHGQRNEERLSEKRKGKNEGEEKAPERRLKI